MTGPEPWPVDQSRESHLPSLIRPRKHDSVTDAYDKLIRKTYETSLVSLVRPLHYERNLSRESIRTKEFITQCGFPSSNSQFSEIFSVKSSKKLFILGSGSSVNFLSDSQFREIQNGYSIGINAWVSHEFVPDVYSFEADDLPDGPEAEVEKMSDALLDRATSHPQTSLLLLRPKRLDLFHRMVRIPKSLIKRSFMYGRQNLLTKEEVSLRRDLGSILVRSCSGFARNRVSVDNGASVVRMVAIGLAAGFSEIVLIGIDLNTSPYFWEVSEPNARNLDMKQFYRRPKGEQHDTLETTDRPYSTLDFLVAMGLVAKTHFGANLTIGTRNSALSEYLGEYRWEKPLANNSETTVSVRKIS